jgi:hypothetical protein
MDIAEKLLDATVTLLSKDYVTSQYTPRTSQLIQGLRLVCLGLLDVEPDLSVDFDSSIPADQLRFYTARVSVADWFTDSVGDDINETVKKAIVDALFYISNCKS